MKLNIIKSLLCVSTLVCGTLSASAAVLTFDSVGPTGNIARSGTVTVGGYDFTSPSFHINDDPTNCAGGCIDMGSEYLAEVAPNFDSPVTITATGGGAFSLTSLSAAPLFLTPGGIGSFPNADTVTLQGFVVGGGTVNQSLTLGAEGVVSNFNLIGFTNLSSITLGGTYLGGDASFAVDNLDLSTAGSTATPEPSSMLLAIAGTAALIASRRHLRGAK